MDLVGLNSHIVIGAYFVLEAYGELERYIKHIKLPSELQVVVFFIVFFLGYTYANQYPAFDKLSFSWNECKGKLKKVFENVFLHH